MGGLGRPAPGVVCLTNRARLIPPTASLALGLTAAAQNLIRNGSFESPVIASNSYQARRSSRRRSPLAFDDTESRWQHLVRSDIVS